jgi:hypothetical protein
MMRSRVIPNQKNSLSTNIYVILMVHYFMHQIYKRTAIHLII